MLSNLFQKVPWLIIALLTLIAGLQYQLWLGPRNLVHSFKLKHEIINLKKNAQKQANKNQTLRSKVNSLKSQPHSIEKIARYHLGMIREGETYYQIVDSQHKDQQSTR